MISPPTGTVTFLFTDIEGSTRLWERHPRSMGRAIIRHDDILRSRIAANEGYVFATGGDSFSAAFSHPHQAVNAALEIQREVGSAEWPETGRLHVRVGIHTGIAEEREGNYFGPHLNRAARVRDAAQGGETVVSATTAALVRHVLPEGITFSNLGRRRLRGLDQPERLYLLQAGGPRRRSLIPASVAVGMLVLVALGILAVSMRLRNGPAETTVSVMPGGGVWEQAWEADLDGPAVELAAHGPRVITASAEGLLQAFDIENGSALWEFDGEAPLNDAPVFDSTTAYFTVAVPSGDLFFALSLADGTRRWRCGFEAVGVTAPALGEDSLYLGAANNLHRFPTERPACLDPLATERARSTVTAPPIHLDGAVFAGTQREIYRLDSSDMQTVWSVFPAEGQPVEHDTAIRWLKGRLRTVQRAFGLSRHLYIVAIDAEDTLFTLDGEEGVVAAQREEVSLASLFEDTLITIDPEGTLMRLDLESLEPRWVVELEGSPDVPAAADQKMVVAAAGQSLLALDVEDGDELGRFTAPSPVNGLLLSSGNVLATTSDGLLLSLRLSP